MNGGLEVTRRGAVAVLRYDHPPRNFMTARLLRALRVAMDRLERDPSVRVVVLTGARPGHFILHLEVAEIEALLASTPRLPALLRRMALLGLRLLVAVLSRWPFLARRLLPNSAPEAAGPLTVLDVLLLFDALERSSKVTVAAIDGSCVGGGFELALCCDYRLVSDADNSLGLPEILVGMMPGFGGTQRLMALVGERRAKELLLEGRVVSPREAAALGLVSKVLPRASFEAAVLAFGGRLARRPPAAVRAIKTALRRGAAASPARRPYVELDALAPLAGSQDTREGLAAYRADLAHLLALPAGEQPDARQLVARLETASLSSSHPRRGSRTPVHT